MNSVKKLLREGLGAVGDRANHSDVQLFCISRRHAEEENAGRTTFPKGRQRTGSCQGSAMEKIAGKFADQLVQREIVEEGDRDFYQYAIESLFIYIVNVAVMTV